MARIICRKTGSIFFLELIGSASLQNAEKAKAFFLTIVNGNCSECHIDMSGIQEMDLSYVELLVSFSRTMERENKKLFFSKLPEGHPVSDFLIRAGFLSAEIQSKGVNYGL
jgi:anti-anti-sigma regulatory factor